jgi:hypothetical protein
VIHVRTGSRWDQPPFPATPGQELIEDHLPDVVLRPVLLGLLAPVEPASTDCSVRPEMISHMRVPPGRPGRIILLNGTSSSGKTSIAEELLPTLIKDFLARDERPTAFGRLRATLKSQVR